uniref:PHD-type domain-containing protein n=2 Tax=Lygus hesperus TaxID=30085 RepID=A0A146KWE8_LYGHE
MTAGRCDNNPITKPARCEICDKVIKGTRSDNLINCSNTKCSSALHSACMNEKIVKDNTMTDSNVTWTCNKCNTNLSDSSTQPQEEQSNVGDILPKTLSFDILSETELLGMDTHQLIIALYKQQSDMLNVLKLLFLKTDECTSVLNENDRLKVRINALETKIENVCSTLTELDRNKSPIYGEMVKLQRSTEQPDNVDNNKSTTPESISNPNRNARLPSIAKLPAVPNAGAVPKKTQQNNISKRIVGNDPKLVTDSDTLAIGQVPPQSWSSVVQDARPAQLKSQTGRPGSGSANIRPPRPKRIKNVISGKNLAKNSLSVVAKKKSIFVTRLSPATTANDLVDFLVNLKLPFLKCTKLKTNYDSYSSFHVQVLETDFTKIFSGDVWPQGILVSEYHGPLKDDRIFEPLDQYLSS